MATNDYLILLHCTMQALSAVHHAILENKDAVVKDAASRCAVTALEALLLTFQALQNANRRHVNAVLLPRCIVAETRSRKVCCVRHHKINVPTFL